MNWSIVCRLPHTLPHTIRLLDTYAAKHMKTAIKPSFKNLGEQTFNILGHLVKKNATQNFERWSSSRVIEANVQGGLIFMSSSISIF